MIVYSKFQCPCCKEELQWAGDVELLQCGSCGKFIQLSNEVTRSTIIYPSDILKDEMIDKVLNVLEISKEDVVSMDICDIMYPVVVSYATSNINITKDGKQIPETVRYTYPHGFPLNNNVPEEIDVVINEINTLYPNLGEEAFAKEVEYVSPANFDCSKDGFNFRFISVDKSFYELPEYKDELRWLTQEKLWGIMKAYNLRKEWLGSVYDFTVNKYYSYVYRPLSLGTIKFMKNGVEKDCIFSCSSTKSAFYLHVFIAGEEKEYKVAISVKKIEDYVKSQIKQRALMLSSSVLLLYIFFCYANLPYGTEDAIVASVFWGIVGFFGFKGLYKIVKFVYNKLIMLELKKKLNLEEFTFQKIKNTDEILELFPLPVPKKTYIVSAIISILALILLLNNI